MNTLIAIIGCGSIGTEILRSINNGDIPHAKVVAIVEVREGVAEMSLGKLNIHDIQVFSDFQDFLNSSVFTFVDIVVEAASQLAVRNYGKRILEFGKKFLILSSGVFADPILLTEFVNLAEQKKAEIVIPTGAIAGIDAIRSVKKNLTAVTITTTKNPISLSGAPFFKESKIKAETITCKTLLYKGSAEDAISKFPANVNVAVTLALAGVGLKRTEVSIIADPDIKINQHEIHASGNFGDIRITLRNNPIFGNPRTSMLAALSAIESLRGLCYDTFRIGS
ncbi:MAG: aspartate dehydrogenase [Thermoproteota archaeon]|nr:aspartate dehydrogenase [Thermoproteota archaeon]